MYIVQYSKTPRTSIVKAIDLDPPIVLLIFHANLRLTHTLPHDQFPRLVLHHPEPSCPPNPQTPTYRIALKGPSSLQLPAVSQGLLRPVGGSGNWRWLLIAVEIQWALVRVQPAARDHLAQTAVACLWLHYP